MKKVGKSKRRTSRHHAPSTDSEDLVKVTHKGLDRCASLLAHIMDDKPQEGGERCREKEKQPQLGRRKETKKQPKKGRLSNKQKVKAKGREASEKITRDLQKAGNGHQLRTSYQPALASSTPQSKLKRSVAPKESDDVSSQQVLRDFHYDDSQGFRYPTSHRFNPGLIGGQVIPERETTNRHENPHQEKRRLDVDVKQTTTMGDPAVNPEGDFHMWRQTNSERRPIDRKERMSQECKYNTDQEVNMHPSMYPPESIKPEGKAGYTLYSDDRNDFMPISGMGQSSTVPTDSTDMAKSVLRDLVDTLKTINERDAVSLDTKSKQRSEMDSSGCVNEWHKDNFVGIAESGAQDIPGSNTGMSEREDTSRGLNHIAEKNAERNREGEQLPVDGTFRGLSNETAPQSHNRPDRNVSWTENQRTKENVTLVELGRRQQLRELDKENEKSNVVQAENIDRNDENGTERWSSGHQTVADGERSPDSRKSPDTTKKMSGEVTGKSSNKSKGKKPLLEQQRVLRCLVTELKTVIDGSVGLEADHLFHSILDTIDTLPFLTMDREVHTEIAMALQPLRSENASLRRKLRIANQQMREAQRQIEESGARNMESSEISKVKELNTRLHKELESEQQERDALVTLVKKLREDLEMAKRKCEDLSKVNEQKDECHLRSQSEWMSEMATIRRQQTCSKQEVETGKWKLEMLKKENDQLQNHLRDTKSNLERAEQRNQWLEGMLAELGRSKQRHTTEHVTNMGKGLLPTCQSELNKLTSSPKRKRDFAEAKGSHLSLKVKRDRGVPDYTRGAIKGQDIPGASNDTTNNFLGGPIEYQVKEDRSDVKRFSDLQEADQTRWPSLYGKEKVENNDLLPRDTVRKQIPVFGERVPAEQTRNNLWKIYDDSTSYSEISKTCHHGYNSGRSGKFFQAPITAKAQSDSEVTLSYDRSLLQPNTFTSILSSNGNNIENVNNLHLPVTCQNLPQRLESATKGSDNISVASDSTTSSVTSLFEVQFQLGLSNLDEKITKLQENLQNLKGYE